MQTPLRGRVGTQSLLCVLVFVLVIASSWVGTTPRALSKLVFRPERFVPRSVKTNKTVPLRTFSWPQVESFRDRFSNYQRDGRAVKLLEAEITLRRGSGERVIRPSSFLTIRGPNNQLQVAVFAGPSGYESLNYALEEDGPWTLASTSSFSSGVIELTGENSSLLALKFIDIPVVTHVSPDLWEAWVYSTGLLESDPPVYDDFKDDRYQRFAPENPIWKQIETIRASSGEEAAAALIARALEERSISRHDYGWRREVHSAIARGNDELALRIFRYFVPVGNCSMDQVPREVAREYAEFCYRLGKLGSYLQLRLRIMGDSFERIVYSNYAERVNGTGAEELLATGLDLDRFFLGLMVDVDADKPSQVAISPMRLARSMAESNRTPALTPVLERITQDRRVDDWNRAVAAMTLTNLRIYELMERKAYLFRMPMPENPELQKARENEIGKELAEVQRIMERLNLTSGAKAWVKTALEH